MVAYYSLKQGQRVDLSQASIPLWWQTWDGGTIALPAQGTHFGFVFRGRAQLQRAAGDRYTLQSGMYFALPEGGKVGGRGSQGLVVTHLTHRGLFHLGGPLEATGRFAYINGGSDSLLIPPLMQGDPCLNALYFPPGVDQSLHTHPSDRLGVVVAGCGVCDTLDQRLRFTPGMVFYIPADMPHKFLTQEDPLTLLVFHPDSDTGFTHQNHPMLRRTFVDGVSAVQLPEIQTTWPPSLISGDL